ncbi:hypothetical protein [Altibacter sp.]|uniref:hypothetical protein n=1 Tax=Altibacter sp. TaxID=2024823 RepID=UPI00258DF270|nr:hypothetical protein [Altibacter sp.]MCW9037300.1 hypothetical protein [Altibacter sp.]
MKPVYLILLLGSLMACSKSNTDDAITCTEEFVYGLNVTVRDANTDVLLTDAEVTVQAQDNDYNEMLEFNAVVFLGAGERPGTYTLTVTGVNYETFISDPIAIALTEDVCHVVPQAIELRIQPN